MSGFPSGFVSGSLWHLEPFLGLNVAHPVLVLGWPGIRNHLGQDVEISFAHLGEVGEKGRIC